MGIDVRTPNHLGDHSLSLRKILGPTKAYAEAPEWMVSAGMVPRSKKLPRNPINGTTILVAGNPKKSLLLPRPWNEFCRLSHVSRRNLSPRSLCWTQIPNNTNRLNDTKISNWKYSFCTLQAKFQVDWAFNNFQCAYCKDWRKPLILFSVYWFSKVTNDPKNRTRKHAIIPAYRERICANGSNNWFSRQLFLVVLWTFVTAISPVKRSCGSHSDWGFQMDDSAIFPETNLIKQAVDYLRTKARDSRYATNLDRAMLTVLCPRP